MIFINNYNFICKWFTDGRSRKWFSVPETIEILRQRGKDSKIIYFELANCPSVISKLNGYQPKELASLTTQNATEDKHSEPSFDTDVFEGTQQLTFTQSCSPCRSSSSTDSSKGNPSLAVLD